MNRHFRLAPALLLCTALHGQLFTLTRDQLIKYTAKNPFERFEDGRPKVPDSVLEKVKQLSAEDVFIVLTGAGFTNQYAGNWRLLHPGKKLVGRAVTAQFMPGRPDVASVIEEEAKAKGRRGAHNQWVIDTLQPGDVLVADLFGKIENGTMMGDNLATAIYGATRTGFVVDGGIRDLEGIYPIGMAGYYRGAHPSIFRDLVCTGINVPVRIGGTMVMPGDVVLGDREGVYFIPPALVEQVLNKAEETQVHDEWTKSKLLTGKYRSTDLYPVPRDPALKKEYEEFKKQRLGK
jgi:regulator of RNase E activity RraA